MTYATDGAKVANQRPKITENEEATMKIGFIGLGMMGAGMASNLQKAGHDLIVHDLTRQAASKHLNAGATWADSPRSVAEACDIVFTSLPPPADVEKDGSG